MNIQLPCLVRLTTAPRHASPRRCPLSLGLSGSMARCVLVIPFVAADFNVLLSLYVRVFAYRSSPTSLHRHGHLRSCLASSCCYLFYTKIYTHRRSLCDYSTRLYLRATMSSFLFPNCGHRFVFLRVLFGSRSSCSTDYKNVSLDTVASDLLPCERHFAFLPQLALVLLLRCLASSRKLPLFYRRQCLLLGRLDSLTLQHCSWYLRCLTLQLRCALSF